MDRVDAAVAAGRDTGAAGTLRVVRGGLGVIFLLGVVGTGLELILLEHTEDLEQWIPLLLFGVGLVLFLVALLRPTVLSLRLYSLCMLAYVVSGLLGTWYHYAGNVEFELERTPDLGGLALFRSAMEGATPALAPGTMIWLGLLGLLYTFRHPARVAAFDPHA
jgi:hypothetical protein